MRKNVCICGVKKMIGSKVCGLCRSKTGSGNINWKGGKCNLKNGYVVIYVEKGKYRFEHVLVMEKFLGRNLFEGENVHHKNGVRNDNRLSNLELWIRSQPSGIRIKDAVEWAQEILRRYKNIK